MHVPAPDGGAAAEPVAAVARPATAAPARDAPPRRRVRWLAPRQEIPDRAYAALAVLSFLAAAGAWQWLSMQSFVNPVFIPSPTRVWEEFGNLAGGDLWADVRISALRVTAGFLLSAALAIPIGVCMGAFKVGEGLLQPFTEFVRYIPVPALIPILIVLFGIGEPPKIMLIFVGTFFQLVLMVADEIRRVPYDLVQVGYTLGATRTELVRLILWPAALPGVFDALRLCNGWAWTYLVVAELVASNEGLGFRILKFGRFLQTPKIFVYLIILGIIGLAIDLLFRRLNRAAFHWAAKARS